MSFVFSPWASLFLADYESLRQVGNLLQRTPAEACISVHLFVLHKGVRLARIRMRQHDQAESSSHRRSHAIFVGNEFHSDGLSTWLQRGVESAQQHLVGGHIEVVQEV